MSPSDWPPSRTCTPSAVACTTTPVSRATVGPGRSSTTPVASNTATLASATPTRAPDQSGPTPAGSSARTHSPAAQAQPDIGFHLRRQPAPVDVLGIVERGQELTVLLKAGDFFPAFRAARQVALGAPTGDGAEI